MDNEEEKVTDNAAVGGEGPSPVPQNDESLVSEPQTKKKKPFVRFLTVILSVILALLIVLLAALAFCAFDKKASLSAVPRNYSLYVSTNSAFDTVNPLFDLQAADVLLSSPEFSSLRKPFMDLRSSSLRDNALFKFATSRPIDFALYGSGASIGSDSHFVAVLNLGIFSLFSRVGQFMYPKIDLSSYESDILKNLSYENAEQTSYFVYNTGEIKIYFKAVKNLLVASDSLEHLLTSSLVENDISYTDEQKKLFASQKKGELKIVADAHSLMHFVTEGNEILASMANLVSSDSLSVISFNISDSDISLKCRVPISTEEDTALSLSPILSKKSSLPALLSRFSDIIQYYTILNAGNLSELKDALLPFVPDIKNPDEFWKNSDEWCQSLLGLSLDEFLFSWSGNECAVFGIENQNDPVFALQIKDEKQRQKVFNKLTSSILIKDDNSLILGGVRLPHLQLPSFLSWMLSAFGVNLPSPYFMVLDGNIYFSESAECLSNVYNGANSGKALVKNKDYLAASAGLKNEATLSLFYNLERSVPFFLRSNESVSQIFRLYTMGRFDVRLEKDTLEINLHAVARKSGSLNSVAGFPIKLEGKVNSQNLQVEKSKAPKNIFWVENDRTIKALEISSMNITGKNETDKIFIEASAKAKNGGILWSLSNHGIVSLLSANLEPLAKFPLILCENVSVRPTSVGENLVVISETGNVFVVHPDSSVTAIELPDLTAKSEASSSLDGKSFALYSKGFLGKIYYFEGEKCLNLENPFEIPGIALGSPAIMKNGSKTYVGFITQAGEMNVWKCDAKSLSSGEQAEGFPMRLGGVFMKNVVASEKYFYALSNDALLYRISLNGEILSVQIPNSTAKEGYISCQDIANNGRFSIFVCADANVIYGFNENLELLPGYPLTGHGNPVFADVNGDKVAECVATTIDQKIVAWKIR
ncbi:MAG: hypothetical protein IJ630_01535 [Treponema sp.]|nr:hypothetical protein [Treponema sp.]